MEKTFNPGKAWLVTIVALLLSTAFALSQFQPPAVMLQIMQTYNIDPVAAGNTMNFVGIVATIVSLPAGMVMMKIGARNLAIIDLGVAILANVLGAIAPNYEMLLASRALFGFGYGLCMVIMPQFIASWFPAQKRGLPNSITSCWVAFGQIIVLNVAPIIVNVTGNFQNVWWFSTAFCAVVLVLVIFFLKLPSEQESQLDDQPGKGGEKVSVLAGMKSVSVWTLLFAFFVFGYVISAFASYFPTYLQQDLAMDLGTANFCTSVMTMGNIVGGFVGGAILAKISVRNYPKWLLILVLIISGVGLCMFNMPSAAVVIPYAALTGFVMQMLPGTVFSIAPDASVSPATLGITLGVIGIGQNIVGVMGTAVSSFFQVTFGGWSALTIPIAIFCAI
ncbi:MAG: MFS transporter, partial [Raoultibacter sp.]